MIPRFGPALQAGIAKVYALAEQALRSAEAASANAEGKLLAELQLADWNPPRPLHYLRRSSEAFGAGRLDAEYFSPRVRELMARLGRSSRTLAEVATVRREVFVAEGAGDFKYIEIGSVGADGTAKAEFTPHDEAPSRAAWIVRAGDVITSMVRPIRRLSAQIGPEQEGAVCSSGFVVLQPNGLPPEVLLTYLRLPLVCEVLDLHTSASLYPAISEGDLLRLPVPAIAGETQQEIVNAVAAARADRKRAQALLATAQRAVEIAIEDSEESALQHLRLAEKLHRRWVPLKDRVRVEPFPGALAGQSAGRGYVIPDSA
jgi:type I restriction enzyme, S subunit